MTNNTLTLKETEKDSIIEQGLSFFIALSNAGINQLKEQKIDTEHLKEVHYAHNLKTIKGLLSFNILDDELIEKHCTQLLTMLQERHKELK